MASAPTTIYVCTATFTFEKDGIPHVVHRGELARVGHPIMKGREDMFAPVKVTYEVARPPKGGPGGPR